MSNSLSAGFKEVWAKKYETEFHKQNVAKMICNMSYDNELKSGDVLNRVYRSTDPSNPQIDSYTRGAAITLQDITDTAETLTVNRQFAKGFTVDDFDAVQSNYDIALAYGKDNAIFMSNQLDADVLGQWSAASETVDDADVGGTSGNSIALSTSNLLSTVSSAKKELRKNNIPANDLFAVISPEFEQVLIEYAAGRDTSGMGDEANRNGFLKKFYSFDFYVSNQLSDTKVLSIATQVTADDTITVNGVTFKVVASPAVAGDVDLGADADATRANLAAAINGGAGAGTAYIEVSAANRRKLLNVTATNDNTANTLTLTGNGVGVLTVSETLTDAVDGLVAAKSAQHCLFGQKGAIDVITQIKPMIKTVPKTDSFGTNILTGTLYGLKTFADGAPRLINVNINSANF